MNKNIRNIVISIIVTALCCLTVFYFVTRSYVMIPKSSFDESKDFMALAEIYEDINENFFYDVPSKEDMSSAAANAMVAKLNDDYAQYFTAEEYEQYTQSSNGEYCGVGILIAQPDETGTEVLDVYEGPAKRAGILTGDIITYFDDFYVGGKQLEDLSSVTTGPEGSQVTIKLLRNGEELVFTVIREPITISRVAYKMLDDFIGYIRIDMFTGDCVEGTKKAISSLNRDGMKSLIIDVRNNPGGSLYDVVEICDMLLEKDKNIVSIKNKSGEDQLVFNATTDGLNIPIAILVNENSASASEILAGAVQDNELGAIVGTTTFGKGIVQTTYPLKTNGGWIKMTTDAYYTPSGRNIHGIGIEPNIKVEFDGSFVKEQIKDIGITPDNQLNKAMSYLLDKMQATANN